MIHAVNQIKSAVNFAASNFANLLQDGTVSDGWTTIVERHLLHTRAAIVVHLYDQQWAECRIRVTPSHLILSATTTTSARHNKRLRACPTSESKGVVGLATTVRQRSRPPPLALCPRSSLRTHDAVGVPDRPLRAARQEVSARLFHSCHARKPGSARAAQKPLHFGAKPLGIVWCCAPITGHRQRVARTDASSGSDRCLRARQLRPPSNRSRRLLKRLALDGAQTPDQQSAQSGANACRVPGRRTEDGTIRGSMHGRVCPS
jgi:hypothetical protein